MCTTPQREKQRKSDHGIFFPLIEATGQAGRRADRGRVDGRRTRSLNCSGNLVRGLGLGFSLGGEEVGRDCDDQADAERFHGKPRLRNVLLRGTQHADEIEQARCRPLNLTLASDVH